MKFLLITLFSCYYSFSQDINPKLKPILDSTISKCKDLSYYSHIVNWDSLETQIFQAAKNATDLEGLKPAFEVLLNGLTDHHGTIRRTSDYSILAHFSDYGNARNADNREYKRETWSVVNNPDARFEYSILPNKIGYLKVVGIGQNVDGQKEAERIRNALIQLHEQKVEHWILDLRYNGGGNINIMLAGLAPLLDEIEVAAVRDANNEIQGTAEIKNGDFWYFGQNSFKVETNFTLKNPKIAILTSRWTVSSGELTAVAFKGQTNTRFFGERTGGYTTNNGWEVINDQIALIISTGVYCDRNGTKYPHYVVPDIEIEFEVTTDKTKDAGIIQAIDWLKKK